MAPVTSPAPKATNPFVVTAAAVAVNAVLALGLLAMCMRLAAGGTDGLPVRQFLCAAACWTYLAILCCANLLLADDARVDGAGGTQQGARVAATAYLATVGLGTSLLAAPWAGTALFVVAWIMTVSFSMVHLDRLVGHALGGRSRYARD